MEHVILDTDLGGDVDDLGALAVLHTLRAAGWCELLGVMSVTPQHGAIEAITATNRHLGGGAVPIGRPPWAMRRENSYADAVARRADVSLDLSDVPLATPLYRRLLHEAPDASVTIATIGPLLLVDQLLNSPGDAASPLTGRQLVEAKLKRVVVMGGFETSSGPRAETNFGAWDVPGVTARVIDALPCPVTICPFELGAAEHGYGTGTPTRRTAARTTPCAWATSTSSPTRRPGSPATPKISSRKVNKRTRGVRLGTGSSARGRSGTRSPFCMPRCPTRRGWRSTGPGAASSTTQGANRWSPPDADGRVHGLLQNRVSPATLAHEVIDPLMRGLLPEGLQDPAQ